VARHSDCGGIGGIRGQSASRIGARMCSLAGDRRGRGDWARISRYGCLISKRCSVPRYAGRSACMRLERGAYCDFWLSPDIKRARRLGVAWLVGRAILPAAGFSAGSSRLKGGCGQDWPPHKSKLTLTWRPRGGDAQGCVSGYCLSQTIVALYALPSAFVPLMVLVVVLPSFETTLRPVTLYFPSFFFVL